MQLVCKHQDGDAVQRRTSSSGRRKPNSASACSAALAAAFMSVRRTPPPAGGSPCQLLPSARMASSAAPCPTRSRSSASRLNCFFRRSERVLSPSCTQECAATWSKVVWVDMRGQFVSDPAQKKTFVHGISDSFLRDRGRVFCDGLATATGAGNVTDAPAGRPVDANPHA